MASSEHFAQQFITTAAERVTEKGNNYVLVFNADKADSVLTAAMIRGGLRKQGAAVESISVLQDAANTWSDRPDIFAGKRVIMVDFGFDKTKEDFLFDKTEVLKLTRSGKGVVQAGDAVIEYGVDPDAFYKQSMEFLQPMFGNRFKQLAKTNEDMANYFSGRYDDKTLNAIIYEEMTGRTVSTNRRTFTDPIVEKQGRALGQFSYQALSERSLNVAESAVRAMSEAGGIPISDAASLKTILGNLSSDELTNLSDFLGVRLTEEEEMAITKARDANIPPTSTSPAGQLNVPAPETTTATGRKRSIEDQLPDRTAGPRAEMEARLKLLKEEAAGNIPQPDVGAEYRQAIIPKLEARIQQIMDKRAKSIEKLLRGAKDEYVDIINPEGVVTGRVKVFRVDSVDAVKYHKQVMEAIAEESRDTGLFVEVTQVKPGKHQVVVHSTGAEDASRVAALFGGTGTARRGVFETTNVDEILRPHGKVWWQRIAEGTSFFSAKEQAEAIFGDSPIGFGIRSTILGAARSRVMDTDIPTAEKEAILQGVKSKVDSSAKKVIKFAGEHPFGWYAGALTTAALAIGTLRAAEFALTSRSLDKHRNPKVYPTDQEYEGNPALANWRKSIKHQVW